MTVRTKRLPVIKKKLKRNTTSARGTSKITTDGSSKIGIKSRTASTVYAKKGNTASKKAACRIKTSENRIKKSIDKKGGPVNRINTTRPIKAKTPDGKSRIVKKKLKVIPKIGPSTMRLTVLSKGKNTFKGLKKSKAIKPTLRRR